MKRSILYLLALLSAVTAEAQKENWKVTDKGPSIDNYFTPASAEAATPDDEGFIRRWLLLEPIDKPNHSNTVFTDSYLQQHLGKAYLKDQFTSMPKNGQKVKVGKQKLKWHALNSKLFNVKLFRFATGLDKQYYGIVFLATTTIECDEDIGDVRLSVGSNSASMWWIDGKQTLMLSGDRRMVADDAMSQRLTLKKGTHILHGAVINGPGMSDFCVRFIDDKGQPLKNLRIR